MDNNQTFPIFTELSPSEEASLIGGESLVIGGAGGAGGAGSAQSGQSGQPGESIVINSTLAEQQSNTVIVLDGVGDSVTSAVTELLL